MMSVCWPLLEPEPQMYGEVKSPQYPKPYPPNLQEQWDLIVPEGFQLRMTFTHLDIEASAGCHYDSLTVRATFKDANIAHRADRRLTRFQTLTAYDATLCFN